MNKVIPWWNLLGNLAERTTLLAEVDDEADATTLGAAHALFDGVDQVWLTCADVRAKHVGTIAYGRAVSQKSRSRMTRSYIHRGRAA